MCPYEGGAFTLQTGTIDIPPDRTATTYGNSVWCEYVITTGAPIYLRFDSFATEAQYDYVEVYDGTNATGARKGKFSGTSIPPMQTATSGSMFIRFVSDSNQVTTGVSMTWQNASGIFGHYFLMVLYIYHSGYFVVPWCSMALVDTAWDG